ncbi:nucleoside triphosphate pyrophosphohydrolase [Oceanobacillus alkalisoli]|uniref:nucleoside triphosphate pyrophosphohydrolase n=1 Tax=Oceanobacillus alkalisoli TaxID=2925113 RepID=UPI001F11D0F3|nr:nucleoside triphosphate pyrophosphohydrolase [Oceanobacillus alkalisoli]MCF3944464.1 nucleoside triphosphate pyrophosphohydrolase [Oceanobacillus alkalisoli]
MIEVIGLGAGDINQLSIGVYKKLLNSEAIVYTRTLDHPVITDLQQEGVRFYSFDKIYEEMEDFAGVYEKISTYLLDKAKDGPVIYTVPGHPMLAERTVQLLLEQDEVPVEISGGQSYLDALFTSLEIDPIEGFQFVDGTSFERRQLNYEQHLVFCQVYDSFIASEVKLSLLEDLPPEYEVTIVEAAGTEKEQLTKLRIEDLDRTVEVSNLTSVYVPPIQHDELSHRFSRLVEVIAALRGPDGCPWDQKQTHESLRAHTIEEVYELIDAIDQEDDDNITEELGDLLMHVVLHSQIGADSGYFSIEDVILSATEKMIHRHPHVFGDVQVDSAAEVLTNWDALKQQEKGKQRDSILEGIPKHLPALAKAAKIQQKAAKVGFDWAEAKDVWAKLEEEVKEVKAAITSGVAEDIEDEFGDVLFVLANLTRFYQINAEVALNRANRKFISRFTHIEQRIKRQGKRLEEATLDEMEAYWQEAKESE